MTRTAKGNHERHHDMNPIEYPPEWLDLFASMHGQIKPPGQTPREWASLILAKAGIRADLISDARIYADLWSDTYHPTRDGGWILQDQDTRPGRWGRLVQRVIAWSESWADLGGPSMDGRRVTLDHAIAVEYAAGTLNRSCDPIAIYTYHKHRAGLVRYTTASGGTMTKVTSTKITKAMADNHGKLTISRDPAGDEEGKSMYAVLFSGTHACKAWRDKEKRRWFCSFPGMKDRDWTSKSAFEDEMASVFAVPAWGEDGPDMLESDPAAFGELTIQSQVSKDGGVCVTVSANGKEVDTFTARVFGLQASGRRAMWTPEIMRKAMKAKAIKVAAKQVADMIDDVNGIVPVPADEDVDGLDTVAEGEAPEVEAEAQEMDDQGLCPYDPDALAASPFEIRSVSLDSLLRKINTGSIHLSPGFQREADLWPLKSKGLLIESVLLSIPLPVIVLWERGDGVSAVVDGLQRLTALRQWAAGEFKLNGARWLAQHVGKTHQQLPQRLRDRFNDTQIVTYVIRQGLPASVALDVFSRYNSQGVKLNRMELRWAALQGKGTDLISRISGSPEWLAVISQSDKRMKARELALRAIAWISHGPVRAKHEQHEHLTETLAMLNMMSEEEVEQYGIRVKRALSAAASIFGAEAFKAHSHNEETRKIEAGRFRASHFDVWLWALDACTDQQLMELEDRKQAFMTEVRALQVTQEWLDVTSKATNRPASIEDRCTMAAETIGAALGLIGDKPAAKDPKPAPEPTQDTDGLDAAGEAEAPEVDAEDQEMAQVEEPETSMEWAELSNLNRDTVTALIKKVQSEGGSVVVTLPDGNQARLMVTKAKGKPVYVLDKKPCSNLSSLIKEMASRMK